MFPEISYLYYFGMGLGVGTVFGMLVQRFIDWVTSRE